jgi:type II secretion system protein G
MRKAFTLIELLVVIVILGILTAIVVPRITGRVDQAKIEATKVQMKAIKDALEQYKLDNGFYPTTEQGLKSLGGKAKHFAGANQVEAVFGQSAKGCVGPRFYLCFSGGKQTL